MLDIIAAIGIFSYLTSLQTPKTSLTITASTASFSILYGIIKKTRFLHPQINQIKRHEEAEWRSRIIGTLHAIILFIGSILCFLEWSHLLQPSHAWHVVADERTTTLSPEVIEYHPLFFASIFVGYLQYDMLWLLYHRQTNFDAGSMIHHALYITITHYVLYGYYFVRPFAWLSFCELSTPFMHARWFYAVRGKSYKESRWYTIYSLSFAVTFLFSRVACYGWGLVDLWSVGNREVWMTLPFGVYAVVVGLHLGYVLNLFWAGKVSSALTKYMGNAISLRVKKTS